MVGIIKSGKKISTSVIQTISLIQKGVQVAEVALCTQSALKLYSLNKHDLYIKL